ncbi:MAG: hypothetical protein V2A71_01910 [Candidatus Eisenbacteria bacterium]
MLQSTSIRTRRPERKRSRLLFACRLLCLVSPFLLIASCKSGASADSPQRTETIRLHWQRISPELAGKQYLGTSCTSLFDEIPDYYLAGVVEDAGCNLVVLHKRDKPRSFRPFTADLGFPFPVELAVNLAELRWGLMIMSYEDFLIVDLYPDGKSDCDRDVTYATYMTEEEPDYLKRLDETLEVDFFEVGELALLEYISEVARLPIEIDDYLKWNKLWFPDKMGEGEQKPELPDFSTFKSTTGTLRDILAVVAVTTGTVFEYHRDKIVVRYKTHEEN